VAVGRWKRGPLLLARVGPAAGGKQCLSRNFLLCRDGRRRRRAAVLCIFSVAAGTMADGKCRQSVVPDSAGARGCALRRAYRKPEGAHVRMPSIVAGTEPFA